MLPELLLKIEQEHELIEAMIRLVPLYRIPCDGNPEAASCRDRIREALASHLKLACQHFEHEHQVMRAIFFPKALLDDHAIEHDAILDRINRMIHDLGNGISAARLLDAFETLAHAYRTHTDGLDKILYDHLDECFPGFRGARKNQPA